MAESDTGPPGSRPRLRATRREGDRVMPLELFFDLVFVLALTQCTALMAGNPTWHGLGKGAVVLGLLWWPWVGYSWLTSVIDPEEGAVRLAIFSAMAAFLVAALAVPEVFGDSGFTFAVCIAIVRAAHIALFVLASRDEPDERRSVIGLAASTAIGVSLLTVASLMDGGGRVALFAVALVLDVLGPYLFGAEGWHLAPRHFAERHGLIVIIALGESIVAIGVGAEKGLSAGVVAAAVVGVALACALWWMYFDVVAYVGARRLVEAPAGRVRNELARDAYSYLHFLMVLGIVLVALGLKQTLAHVDEPLDTVRAAALLGGVAMYLLGHVAVRLRSAHTLNKQRLGLAVVLGALVPAATQVDAVVAVAAVTVLVGAVIAYETHLYGEARAQVRHEPNGR